MSDANTLLKTIKCETKRDSAEEDAPVIEVLDYLPDERSNCVADISTTIHRSVSEDFQDSSGFLSFVEEMSHPGGTNSLPAFLTGRSGGHTHSALLQQSQSNRAVENDYCENPPPQRIPPSRTHGRSTRNTTGTHDHHHRRHRQHHHPRDPNGTRHHKRASNRRHCNREEGTQLGFHGAVSTSVTSTSTQQGDGEFDVPPPRPPLSKYHIEHRYASRALRPSSSLPASLPVRSGTEILVPMRHNPVPSYQPRHGRSDRQRTGGSSPRSSSETLRGYSLTPPPVCRANKPKYDSKNRIIQTVSSPSVVTQCVDSSWQSQNQWSFLPSPDIASSTGNRCSPVEAKSKSAFNQPTHVVISQQPKRRSKKKLLDDDDDEISRQKRGLVVNVNNNFAKSTQPISGEKTKKKKKSKSAKPCETKDSKTPEFDKLVPADSSQDNGGGDQLSSTEITPLKSGERCPRCGKCSENDPEEKTSKKTSENPPENRCDSAVDTCIETATCFCCVKGLFYHCLSHEDEETFAEKPCSCQSEKCCIRWSIMGILSLCLPCLCCYPLARGSVKLCRARCGCLKSGRRSDQNYS